MWVHGNSFIYPQRSSWRDWDKPCFRKRAAYLTPLATTTVDSVISYPLFGPAQLAKPRWNKQPSVRHPARLLVEGEQQPEKQKHLALRWAAW